MSCYGFTHIIIILNTQLIKRNSKYDYSIHTEGMPIQLIMFDDRMEIRNPGGHLWENQDGSVGKSAAGYQKPCDRI